MALTRDFKETVKERAARDPAFAKAMLDEAATAFLNGEPHVSRLILRDLVNTSVGFEDLASETKRPSKSLHRMLSEKGNPSMDNLASIFRVVCERLGVSFEAHSIEATQPPVHPTLTTTCVQIVPQPRVRLDWQRNDLDRGCGERLNFDNSG